MAQFEAQADKAAASSKAAKEAKSKETKEEREKREKYEKLMKKAEELTAARNHREAVSVLTQAKAHANAAQLKEIEEKIKAADTEMNRGSLFDLMEQEAQPEPSVQQQQPHSQQPVYRRDHNRHTRSIRNSQEYGHRNNSRHSRKQDRRYSRTRNTYS